MLRVAAGELPETLRLARPRASGGVRQARRARRGLRATPWRRPAPPGFGSVLRLAGGRAAVFHEGTLELAHAVPDRTRAAASTRASRTTAELIARALRRLGVDARVGEVPGEYCPGASA